MKTSAVDIDRAILSSAKDRWQKVAMIVASLETALGDMTEREA